MCSEDGEDHSEGEDEDSVARVVRITVMVRMRIV